MQAPERILRLPQVESQTGLKRDSIYTGAKEGWFPKPIRITPNGTASGWRESQVQAYIHERIAKSEGVPLKVTGSAADRRNK